MRSRRIFGRGGVAVGEKKGDYLMENEVNTVRQWLEAVLSDFSPQSRLLCLLNFLKEKIPFEHALVFRIDRKKQTHSVIIDYTPRHLRQEVSVYSVNCLVPLKYLNDIMDNGSINLVNNINFDTYISAQKLVCPYNITSYISYIIDVNEYDSSFIVLMVVHHEHNMFSEYHKTILADLKDILKQSVLTLLLEDAEQCLQLCENGELSVSPDAMLRRCPGMSEVMRLVDAIALTSGTVLISGPTGVGKELVAESLHALSPRRCGPLVKVNCGAIPDTLIDAELFGHEKGAFTGAAAARPGYFEQAQRGTIYLDEVGELSLAAQVRLLRVLESREVCRVGGVRRIPLNIRVVAATNRSLADMVNEGTFREDLWYRLNVFSLRIPSLSRRPDDIPVLAEQFYRLAVKEQQLAAPPAFTWKFVGELAARSWPGNVRQLRHAVERAVLMGSVLKQKTLHMMEEEPESQEENAAGGRRPLRPEPIRAEIGRAHV